MMNTNGDVGRSTASGQLSVVGPSMSTATSTFAFAPSLTSNANGSDFTRTSVSTSEGGPESQQFWSNRRSLPALREYCQSDSLSLAGLRQRLQVVDSSYRIILVDICRNDHVTPEIVKFTIDNIPEAPSAISSRGLTPLHLVCANENANRDIARCLIEAYSPDALMEQALGGCTPLYVLCMNGALEEDEAVEILRLLIQRCPGSLQCRTGGLLPIHAAIRNHSSKFCEVLVEACPDSIFIRHEVDEGEIRSALKYILIGSNVDDNVALALVKMLIEKYPEKIRRFRDGDMNTSLHLVAVSRNTARSARLCRLLVHTSPELVFNSRGLTPLHLVCANKNANRDIAQCLIEAYSPDALMKRTRGGCTPLYVLCMNGALDEGEAVEILRLLIQRCPGSLQCRARGLLPIHEAIRNHSSKFCEVLVEACPDSIFIRHEVDEGEIRSALKYILIGSNVDDNVALALVKMLIEKYPEKIRRFRDGDMNTSLHLVAASRNTARSARLCRLLVHTFPELVFNSRGATPLHLVCENENANRDIAQCLIEAYSPDALMEQALGGCTPLYVLCMNGALDEGEAVEILRLLIQRCPGSLQCRTWRRLPIHAAIRYNSPKFCEVLVEACPDSIFIHHEDDEGKILPVLTDILIGSNVDDSVALALVKMLIEKYPEKIRRFRDGDMNTSLHLVAASRNTARRARLCRLLVHTSPELVFNSRGATPLHLVCANENANRDIARCLIEAYSPDALMERTRGGCTPLYVLCMNGALEEDEAVEILRLLIQRCTGSLQCRTGGLLPIHAAIRNHSSKFCEVLVEACPDSIFIRHEVDEGEILPALKYILIGSNVDDNVALALVKMLIEKYPEKIRRFRDGDMNTSLHLVAASRNTARSARLCRLLVHTSPELVFNSRGLTPLHLVCENKNANRDIAQCLIEAYSPDALMKRTRGGCTPLYVLCMNGALDEGEAVEILRLLIQRCPESLQLQCRTRGRLPIHAAIRYNSPKFCEVLVEACPDSIFIHHEDDEGKILPVLTDILIGSNVDDNVALALLKMLIEKYPEKIRRFRDGDMCTSLHLVACRNTSRSASLCRLLVHTFPELIFERSGTLTGHGTPLHIACNSGSLPVVKCIIESCPSAYRRESGSRGGVAFYPIHSAIATLQIIPETAVEVVKFLMSVNPNKRHSTGMKST
eukprot:scaffold8421_cov83-Skeletonema_menzelii.AAC.1